MAVTVTHAYTATGTDAGNGEVHKAEWNAAHNISGAADLAAANSFTGAGAVLITGTGSIGYGTGAGGTITQATSKSTGVTINKACGQITMNAAALASNTTVLFNVSNSTVAGPDTIIIHLTNSNTASSYLVWIDATGAGAFNVCVRNISGGSLSEAITLNFAVIKGVIS